MKDATHHLKHVQRKIIQSARKESNMERPNIIEASPSVNQSEVQGKRVSAPGRINRLPGYNSIH